jgi:putative transcriptional regulator
MRRAASNSLFQGFGTRERVIIQTQERFSAVPASCALSLKDCATDVSASSIRGASIGDDTEFEHLIASLGTILAETDDDLSLGGDLRLPAIIDAAAIWSKTGLSQAAFARRIGVAVGTLRNWEQSHRKPQGPTRVLLALLHRNPWIVEETLGRIG